MDRRQCFKALSLSIYYLKCIRAGLVNGNMDYWLGIWTIGTSHLLCLRILKFQIELHRLWPKYISIPKVRKDSLVLSVLALNGKCLARPKILGVIFCTFRWTASKKSRRSVIETPKVWLVNVLSISVYTLLDLELEWKPFLKVKVAWLLSGSRNRGNKKALICVNLAAQKCLNQQS